MKWGRNSISALFLGCNLHLIRNLRGIIGISKKEEAIKWAVLGPDITYEAHGWVEKQISVVFFVYEVWAEERNEEIRMKNWVIGGSPEKLVANPS